MDAWEQKAPTGLYAFKSREEALSRVRSILRKRAFANKRSGCDYKIREIKGGLPEDGKLLEVISMLKVIEVDGS